MNKPVDFLFAVIYHPPKYNGNVISDYFFLSSFIPHYEKILIVGDLNVHICCPDKPLVKEFLNIIESFNLTQFVSGPTHQRGHTPDLVLGYRVSVSINGICKLPKLLLNQGGSRSGSSDLILHKQLQTLQRQTFFDYFLYSVFCIAKIKENVNKAKSEGKTETGQAQRKQSA